MTRLLGFTGTRNTLGHEDTLSRYLGSADMYAWLGTFEGYVTGGCRGFDALIGRYLARVFPDARHVVVVPANKSQVDPWWEEAEFSELVKIGTIDVVYMEPGTSYRQRNEWIVSVATEMLYCADYPESDGRSQRSGTWMTVRIAKRAGLQLHGIILNEGAQHDKVRY